MIPPFDSSGYLPPGVYPATLGEVEARFGRGSEIRRAQMESLEWMIDLAMRAGIERIILNGSFVTDIIEPNDVDCALLTSANYPRDEAAAADLEDGLPFLEIAVVAADPFQTLVNSFFATDRFDVPKGVVGACPMELRSETELANTRRKLKQLEEAYDRTRQDLSITERVREVSLRSLKRLINQLKQEIARV